jgi:cellulose synthase/poly-beta-1,6-N-acetylglucosamine synthase-like glycosyltransferase/tetratricopeptide (TPR) repeat protein
LILFASAICVFYLVYRALYTFNLSTGYAVFCSVFLYVGEFFGIINLLLYFLQVWEVDEPAQQPVLEGRTVDVLVPTYNEDPQLLRATLEACIRMDYPHKTYVLDDGRRTEVEALARELGVIYISRPDNRHAKAGNLNNALEQTGGEFVVVLDADHVPEPHFITRLIGYFRDEKMAYVQTPHAFYNFDSFQARLDHANRKYWEEGNLFYRVIQPGRNKWNSAIFAGSAAMFRRSALREIGYIATETITEDMHTGLRLHARGWKSIAISDRLVAGQAPPDIATFHAQRLRWGEGNLSIMAYDNPLTKRGLSLAQRFCYLGSMIHWASGLFKLAIYLTPILMLFTGVPPVREFSWDLIVITLTYLFFSLYAMKVVSNGYGSIINSELFSMVNFWTQIKATFRAMFSRRRQRFVVTPKGPGAARPKSVWPYVRPQTYLIILSVLAIVWGWLRLSLDLNPFRAIVRLFSRIPLEGAQALGSALSRAIEGTFLNYPLIVGNGISDDYFKPVVPTIWCLIFFWLAYKVTQRAFWPADRRISTRHQTHLPVEYEVITDQGAATHYGVTVDLNDTGMSFVAYEQLAMGAVLRFTLRGAGETVKCKGEVRAMAAVARGTNADGYRYGVQFVNLTSPQIDSINRMCLHYAVPRMFDEYERGNRNTFWNRLRLWQSRGMSQRRHARRNPFHLPIIVNTGSTEETMMFSTTEDISRVAAAAVFENEIPLGTHVGFLMPTPTGEIRGTAAIVRSQREFIGGRYYYRCVLEYKDFEAQGRTSLQSLVNPSENSPLTPVLKPDKKNFLPNMRFPIIVGLLIASVLVLAQMGLIFPITYKDEQFLRQIVDKPTLTEDEKAHYRKIMDDTLKDPHPSTDKLVLLMNIGNKLRANRDTEQEGKRDLEQLTQYLAKRDRSNLELSKALVYALYDTQKYAEAEAEYQRLVELGKRGYLSEQDRRKMTLAGARISVKEERYDEALKRFKEVIDAVPNDQALRNEYAGVANAAGRYKLAVEILQASPAIDVEGRKRLIAAYIHSDIPNNYELAAREAHNLLNDTSNAEESQRLLADIRSAQKNYKEQKAILTALLQRQPPENANPDILIGLAQANNSLARDTNSPKDWDESLIILGRLFDRGIYNQQAVDAFVDAASQSKGIEKKLDGYDEAKANRVRGYATKLADDALAAYSDNPSFAVYLTRLGWVLQRVGDNERASALVRRALEIVPNNQDVREQLAGVLLQAGRVEEAARVLGGANTPKARTLMIGIYLGQGDFDNALRLARSIAENEHKWENDQLVADILSWKASKRNDPSAFADAIKIYETHLQQVPGDTVAEARVAEITLWAKFYDDAVAKYQALLEPESRFEKYANVYGEGFINAAASAKQLTPAQIKIAEKLADLKIQATGGETLVLSRLAWVMLKAKDQNRADALLKKIDFAKIDPDAKKEVAGVLAEAGRYREAVRLLDNPKTNEERLALAKLYAGARDWKPAKDQIEAVLKDKDLDPPTVKQARVMLADVLSYKGDHDDALEMFGKLRADYPEDKDLIVREAEVTLWAKRYDRALQMFQELYDKYPAEPKVWHGVASAVAAIAANNTLLKVTPVIPSSYAATVRRIADRVKDANAVDSQLLSRLAVAMFYLDEKERSEAFMNRALELKPRDPVVKREMANSLATLRRFREAIEMYAGIEMNREDRLRLIDIATAGENLDLAVREARLLVQQDPANKKDKRLLADVLAWRGDFSESIALYEQLIKEQPKNQPTDQDLLVNLAEYTLWWRQYPEALVRFGELIDSKVEASRVTYGFIDAASSAPSLGPDHTRQALTIYDNFKSGKQKIEDPARASRLAWIMIKINQPQKADELLKHALSQKPTDASVRKELAGALAARERLDEAIAMFASIEGELNIDERITYAVLLTTRGTQDSLAEARRQFEKLLASGIRPRDVDLRIRYAEMLLWSGKFDKKHYADARREFESLQRDYPKDIRFTIRVAQSLLWSGQYQEALNRFAPLWDTAVVTDTKLERDIWMGYVDSVAGVVGDILRQAALDNEQPDKRIAAFFNEAQRKLVLKAFNRSSALKPEAPNPITERYEADLGYYQNSLGRLGLGLGMMGERDRSREVFEKAIALNRNKRAIWQQYAETLTHLKEFQKAESIFGPLVAGRIPSDLP